MIDDTTTHVRYMVNDVQEAVAFYTEHFGFEQVGPASHAFAAVLRDNLRLMLSGPESSAARPMADGAQPGPGGWNRIHFHTSDLEAEIARLEAAGVPFRNDVVTGPGGQQILVQDPSGNLVELFQPSASFGGT